MPKGLTEGQKEVLFKDQGERFKTIMALTQKMDDSNWDVYREQIENTAKQGLRYLLHFEDFGDISPIEPPEEQ